MGDDLVEEHGRHVVLEHGEADLEPELLQRGAGGLDPAHHGLGALDDLGERLLHQVRDRCQRPAVGAEPAGGEHGVERVHLTLLGQPHQGGRSLGERLVDAHVLLDRVELGVEATAESLGDRDGLGRSAVPGRVVVLVQRGAAGDHLGGERGPHEGLVVGHADRGEVLGEAGLGRVHRLLAGATGLLDLGLHGVELGVDVLDRVEPRARRLEAHRQVAAGDRTGSGEHPVVRAVLRPVLHVRHDRLTGGEVLPQQPEHHARGVRVTDDVVRLAEQLVGGVPAHPHEHLVAGLDEPTRVGGREEQLVHRERTFVCRVRGVAAHRVPVRVVRGRVFIGVRPPVQ